MILLQFQLAQYQRNLDRFVLWDRQCKRKRILHFQYICRWFDPGALLYSTVGIASFVASATPSYFDYSLNLLGPILNAGSQYWVSIYSNDSPTNYAWANSF